MHDGAVVEPCITCPQHRHCDDDSKPDMLQCAVLKSFERIFPQRERDHYRSGDPATDSDPERKRCVEETHESHITRWTRKGVSGFHASTRKRCRKVLARILLRAPAALMQDLVRAGPVPLRRAPRRHMARLGRQPWAARRPCR